MSNPVGQETASSAAATMAQSGQRSSSRAKKPVERFQPSIAPSRSVQAQNTPVDTQDKRSSGSAGETVSNQTNQTPRLTPKSGSTGRGKSQQSQAATQGVKKRNQRRVTKARVTADFLRDLPDGVIHQPDGEDPATQKKKESKDKNIDIVKVGEFIFDIGVVSKASLISMRKYLPSEEYRLLKNRKSARLCRLKRKEERGSMKKTLVEVEAEMDEMKVELEKTQKKLAKSKEKRKLL